jgi:hypothetical protein
LGGQAKLKQRSSNATPMLKHKIREDKIRKDKNITPPSVEEVVQYFVGNGYTEVSGRSAFQYYEEGQWHDSEGKKVISWKQKMRGVWFKPENKIKEPELPISKRFKEVTSKEMFPDA